LPLEFEGCLFAVIKGEGTLDPPIGVKDLDELLLLLATFSIFSLTLPPVAL